MSNITKSLNFLELQTVKPALYSRPPREVTGPEVESSEIVSIDNYILIDKELINITNELLYKLMSLDDLV